VAGDGLSLRGLHFAYPGTGRVVLSGVDLDVAWGQCVAVVGATGAGKTTLMDVVMGLLPPTQGVVAVDGRSIATDIVGWRRQVAYVPQTAFLLDDTIRRNVAFGVDDHAIDDAAVRDALDAAQLRALVDSLPERLETRVGERGVRLSGGERQRLSVARALYVRPRVLVLDEATSSLDPRTERELTQAIDALRGRLTILVIAHRLSTVERADRVVLLQDGRVAAQGTFGDLMRDNPTFRALAAVDA
jgi:ATP-binding cassette subfamily C protein